MMDALHPVGGDICARGPATNGVPTVKAGVLPKGSYKLDDLRRGHIPVRSDGAGLDRLGALWGVSRAVDATTGDMESDESFRRAINARQIRLEPRHMTMFNINVEQEARDINMELQTKARYTPNTPEARHWLRTIVDDSWKELLETKAIRDYQVYPSWLPHLDMAGGNGWKLLAEVKDVKGSYWRFEIVIR